jgi:hypothetical protein
VGEGSVAGFKGSDEIIVKFRAIVDSLAIINMHRDDTLAGGVGGVEFDKDAGISSRWVKASFGELGCKVGREKGIGLLEAVEAFFDKAPFTSIRVG